MPLSNPYGMTGIAAEDLGFGGGLLTDQVKNETEEQRKKRLGLITSMGQSPAVRSLFSALGGLGGPLGRNRP